MKKPTSKTLAVTGLTASLLGMVSSVSFASISWDNDATWTEAEQKLRQLPILRKERTSFLQDDCKSQL